MYSAKEVAEYIIEYASETGSPVSNLKLQKLLYFVQAEFLVNTGKPCFREDIEAWSFGPVVDSVYRKYKRYGGLSIFYTDGATIVNIRKEDKERINEIVDQLREYSAAKLTDITLHQTPWIETDQLYNMGVIPNEKIKAFFEE